jgi:hypothetical protein
MGFLDIINKSPYRVLFYILIPYFIFIVIKLCMDLNNHNEHFADTNKQTKPSIADNKIQTMSPKEANYARSMKEQDNIRKQIADIELKRKKVFISDYQEASKTELELESLHKEINNLKAQLEKCKESSELNKEKSTDLTSDTNKDTSSESTSNTSKDDTSTILKDSPKKEVKEIKEKYKTVVGCEKDSDCNIFYGDGKNTCKSNKQCRCEIGAGVLCQLGPTTYKDPKDMTPKEKTIFKNLSNYDNFTVQDYKNWLGLYKKDYYLLSDEHLINLRKVLRGEPISLRDIPTGGLRPPLTSQKYFAEMYDKLGDLEQIVSPINSSTTGNQVGYNYADYSDFSPPTSLPQLRVVNGEIERKYRRPSSANKIFPVPLEDAVGPYVSNPAM